MNKPDFILLYTMLFFNSIIELTIGIEFLVAGMYSFIAVSLFILGFVTTMLVVLHFIYIIKTCCDEELEDE